MEWVLSSALDLRITEMMKKMKENMTEVNENQLNGETAWNTYELASVSPQWWRENAAMFDGSS